MAHVLRSRYHILSHSQIGDEYHGSMVAFQPVRGIISVYSEVTLILDNAHTRKLNDNREVKEMKKGFAANLEEETRKNTNFRRVLYTGKYSQLVLMCLRPMEDIGEETHDDVDQFFRFEEGEGVVVIDGVKNMVKDGSGVIVPSGAKHNVVNTSKTKNLKLYTIYSPPEHQDKVVRKTKQEALAREEHYDGKPTEK